MPVPPKPADRRQRTNKPKALELVPKALRKMPNPPEGLLPETEVEWADYWSSQIAGLVDPAPVLPVLKRLFRLRDKSYRREAERDRLYELAMEEPFTLGSTGQKRANPLFGVVGSIEAELRSDAAEMRQLEDRFGMTPRAALALGIQFGEAARSLKELNAQVKDRRKAEDPRTAVLEPAEDPRRKASS